MPQVSIVIVCMNRPDILYPCLDSIRGNTSVSYETLVVAYLFSPSNLLDLKARYPWVTVIESNEVRGFSENNNLALRQVQGDFCFVLNDDTVLQEPVIDRLYEDFSKLPQDTAVVAPRLVLEDGSVQFSGGSIPTPLQYLAGVTGLRKARPHIESALAPTENISGAAFLVRTDLFRQMGWFDERYFFTPEDMAVARGLRKAGYALYVDPEAVVLHKWRRTSTPIMSAIRPASIRGHQLFYYEGKGLRCFFFSLSIWLLYSLKRLAALAGGRSQDALTYSNIVRSVFSGRTPKELFISFRP